MFTLAALKAEIVNDPESLGYKTGPDWKGDQEIADLINAKNRTVNKAKIATDDFVGQTTFDAYDGLTASETAYYDMISNRETVAVTDDTLANFAAVGGTSIWAVADRPTMESRMAALMQYTGSRAQELWGAEVEITAGQVGRAANL